MDRRAILTAAPVLAAIAAVPAVAAASAKSAGDEAGFWAAHERWAAIRTGWNADKDPDEDLVFERWNDAELNAFKVMMLIPVGTASAIVAKHKAAHYDHCLPESFALRAIEADLVALAAREAV